MKCFQCGSELPDGARFCSSCGAANERQITTPPVKPRQKPLLLVSAILTGIGLVGLVAYAITARANRDITSIPKAPLAPSGNIVSAPPGQSNSGGIANIPQGNPSPSGDSIGNKPKPKPPQSVVDYLAFVKKAEEHRQMLLKDTISALTLAQTSGAAQSLIGLIDMASDPDGKQARDPLQDTKDELARQYKNWLSELTWFDQKTAPVECREFAAGYRDVLYKETKAIGDVASSFNSVNIMNPQDMQKLLTQLQKLQRDPSIQKGIDDAADKADSQLGKLVSNYDMVKPFDVPREKQTSGNITGF